MDLSIIIVAYNVKELMEKCLLHLRQSKDNLVKEIIYVDNGSNDGSIEMIKQEFKEVHLIASPTNLGFIGANNLAYPKAQGKYILLLNSDAFVQENTLQNLVDFMEQTKDCGVVGCKALQANGNALPSIRSFPTPWRIFMMKMGLADKQSLFKQINVTNVDDTKIQECDWVTGCCLLVRKEVVKSLGILLRPELFMYNDDNDLCLRVKKLGWKVYYHPTRIVHLAGINNEKVARAESDLHRTAKLTLESDYIYMRKNHGIVTVWCHFFLLILYDLIQCFKALFKTQGSQTLKTSKNDMVLAWTILKRTNFGQNPLVRSNHLK